MQNKDKKTRGGIEIGERILAVCGYWSPIMSLGAGIISYQRSKFALFHSIQGGILGFLIVGLGLIARLVGTPVSVYIGMFSMILIFCLIILMLTALFAKKYKLPGIGNLSEKLTHRWYLPKKDK